MAKTPVTSDRQPSQMSDEELWAFVEQTESETIFKDAMLGDGSSGQVASRQEHWRMLWISLVIPPILWIGLVAIISLIIVSWFASQGWYHPTTPLPHIDTFVSESYPS